MSAVLPVLLLSILCVPPARAAGEADKAASGERFLEAGGKSAVGGEAGAVFAGGGGSDRSALDLVNSPGRSKGLKTGAPPPAGRSAMDKALAGGEGAIIGGAAGFVIGGVAGSVLGPAGTVGGATAGAQLGAVLGAGIGFAVGFLLGGKEKSGVTQATESRQRQLDEAMKE